MSDLSKLNQQFSFDGVDFTSASSSNCNHRVTLGLANYKGQALTTGSDDSACYIKSELYNFETNQWTNAPDYPYAS